MPHYGTHALRHTFATRLLRQTKSHQELKAVAELLGDDYKVVVQTYLHGRGRQRRLGGSVGRLKPSTLLHLNSTL
ncbi:MAG: hypothetical protein ACLSA0_10065 [Eisenbergiella massiliensis]